MANNKSIMDTLIQMRNDIKTWVTNNLNNKANVNHTHKYASSSTTGGDANRAKSISYYITTTSSSSNNANNYIKIGTIKITSPYQAVSGFLFFTPAEGSNFAGILNLYIRANANISTISCHIRWTYLSYYIYRDSIHLSKVSDGIYDIYFQPKGTYVTEIITALFSPGYIENGSFELKNSGTFVSSITSTYTSTISGTNYVITSGTEDPSGGQDGDIYIKY